MLTVLRRISIGQVAVLVRCRQCQRLKSSRCYTPSYLKRRDYLCKRCAAVRQRRYDRKRCHLQLSAEEAQALDIAFQFLRRSGASSLLARLVGVQHRLARIVARLP